MRRCNVDKKVPEERLELSSLAAYDFESYVYTNSTTPARVFRQHDSTRNGDFLLK